ncbi:DUF3307 domain-containing protein [Flavisolibacter tropicus]|uniref:DUF3307 domain-containing protein n=1 Tax=Flavisolibacter tropicus TaxID=1492898 RepID=A0A172TR78_9BACT|nr:DUF3307 domain-containing protein [Flavisolibacter tropicus]ANE49496.1 hypothetical protein SY85_02255 [Flavisolibacter tropicus]
MALLLQLFLAHLIGDFFLQPTSWIHNKEAKKWTSPYLYGHAVLHLALLILFTGLSYATNSSSLFYFWKPALLITVLHLLIDGMKLQFQRSHTKRTWFFIDQGLHVVVLFAVWAYFQRIHVDLSVLMQVNILAPITAILFLLKPTSFIIKIAISKWTPSPMAFTPGGGSLENAGELIGILERLLILTFVLLGKWEGVGFLLAAKSVFRFGDLKEAAEMKLTEYVLIGTLLSFGIATATALITLRLMA